MPAPTKITFITYQRPLSVHIRIEGSETPADSAGAGEFELDVDRLAEKFEGQLLGAVWAEKEALAASGQNSLSDLGPASSTMGISWEGDRVFKDSSDEYFKINYNVPKYEYGDSIVGNALKVFPNAANNIGNGLIGLFNAASYDIQYFSENGALGYGKEVVENIAERTSATISNIADIATTTSDYYKNVSASQLLRDADALAFYGLTSAESYETVLTLGADALLAKTIIGRGAADVLDDFRVVPDSTGPGLRPSWRQSELDIGTQLEGQGYRAQISFKDGVEVPYGTKGSTRPEYYTDGSSVEVKNYNAETAAGRNRLVRNVSDQALYRAEHLPAGTQQSIYIDVRGQNVSRGQLNDMIDEVLRRSSDAVQRQNINVLR